MKKKAESIIWLYKSITNSFYLLCSIIVFSIIIAVTNYFSPQILGKFINAIQFGSGTKTMLKILFIYTFISLLQLAFTWIYEIIELKIGQKIVRDFVNSLVDKILNKKNIGLESKDPGDLTTLVFEDIDNLKIFFTELLSDLLLHIIVSVVCFIAIARIDLNISYVVFFTILITIIVQIYFPKILAKKYLDLKDKTIKYNGFIQNIIINLVDVVTINVNNEVKRINNNNLYNKQQEEAKITYMYNNNNVVLTVISNITLFSICYISIEKLNLETMTSGTIVSLIVYFQKIYTEIIKLVSTNMKIQENFISVDRIKEYYQNLSKEIASDNFKEKKSIDNIKQIVWNDVSFRYKNEKSIIKSMNFIIEKGDLVLIQGENGKGKSTIFKILYGILTKYTGDIFINGINKNDIDDENLRKNISYISQKSYIFPDTIRNNITLWEEYSNEMIDNVIDIVGLNKFISESKNGIDEIIENKGNNISGGEYQKIVIARELLRDRDVILLDESFNSIDVKSKNKILEYLKAIRKDKIIILISHDTNMENVNYDFIINI